MLVLNLVQVKAQLKQIGRGIFNPYQRRAIRQFQSYLSLLPYYNKQHHVKFLIFAQGRTGSTLLVDLLNTHSGIFCDGEIFNRQDVGKVFFPFLWVFNRSRRSFLEQKTCYGFKVKIYQLSKDQNFNEYEVLLKKLYGKGWKFIYLERENVIRHALSNLLAEEYMKKGFQSTEKAKGTKVKVDYNRLEQMANARLNYKKEENKIKQAIPGLEISYEKDLKDNTKHQNTCNRIMAFLGLEATTVKTKEIRKASDDLSENILNYEEVINYFKGTVLEKYFYS